MTGHLMSKVFGRVAGDALLGLAAFLVGTALWVDDPAAATAARLFEVPPGTLTALALLAVVFSSLVAFNLAFYRHLRRVYASPRRGAWRRG